MSVLIDDLCKAVRLEDTDGWLFYGFQHRDPLTDELLSIPADQVNSRRWLYILFPEAEKNIKICHVIEPNALSHLPGIQYLYTSLEEFKKILLRFSGLNLAAQVSAELPIFSFIDCGTAELLTNAGIRLSSSGTLVQHIKGVLDKAGLAAHLRSAAHLYEIVELFRQKLVSHRDTLHDLSEKTLQDLVTEEFLKRGLVTDHPPIVAAGKNSGNPHYAPGSEGAPILRDQVVQLDLWAREQGPGGIYADISWVFFTGTDVPREVRTAFQAVCAARNRVITFLNRELPLRTVTGSEADTAARRILKNAGFEAHIMHRTGHGIDSQPHGIGVNLDSVEFPDTRPFMQGSCFSVEPGLYFHDFGLRSEINAYIDGNLAVISGGPIQNEIITFSAQ